MSNEPIDGYLDELFVELRAARPRDARSLLAEAEQHLRESAAELEHGGLGAVDAEREALRRFGSAASIAASDRARHRGGLVSGVAVSGMFLGCVGAIAVGLSGVVAAIMRLAGASDRFLAGRSTADLAPGDCARWKGLYPHASSCVQAALNDWASETVYYRIAFGLLGVMGIAVLLVLRRRSRVGRWQPLPAVIVDAIAASMFGAIGVWTAVLGVDAIVVASGEGAGQWLSAAMVALAAAVVFGFRLLKGLPAIEPLPQSSH